MLNYSGGCLFETESWNVFQKILYFLTWVWFVFLLGPPDGGSLSPAPAKSGCGEKSSGFDSAGLQRRAGKRDTGSVRHLHQWASDQRAQGKPWILWKLKAHINLIERAQTINFLLFHLQTFFRERKPLTLCEKRIRNMEDLCHKLPDNDPIYRMLDSTKRAVEEVTEQITITHLKLEQQPDKWKEWNDRCSRSMRHTWVTHWLSDGWKLVLFLILQVLRAFWLAVIPERAGEATKRDSSDFPSPGSSWCCCSGEKVEPVCG